MTRLFPEALPSRKYWGNGYQIHKTHNKRKRRLHTLQPRINLSPNYDLQSSKKQVLGNRASTQQPYNISKLCTLRLSTTYHWGIMQTHINHALHTLVDTPHLFK